MRFKTGATESDVDALIKAKSADDRPKLANGKKKTRSISGRQYTDKA